MFNLAEITTIARTGTQTEWEQVLLYLRRYEGESDDLQGIKLFLLQHQENRAKLVSYLDEVYAADPVRHFVAKNKRFQLPHWVTVSAASFLLVSGFVLNMYMQRKSLHVVEPVLPVYLADETDWLNKGMAQYKKGDYDAALKSFKTLDSDTAIYYAAVCMELLKQYEMSLVQLKAVPQTSAYYNLSLIRVAAIYAELNLPRAARGVLKNIKPANELETERLRALKLQLK